MKKILIDRCEQCNQTAYCKQRDLDKNKIPDKCSLEDDKTDDIVAELEKIKRELEHYHYDSTRVSDLITKLRGE